MVDQIVQGDCLEVMRLIPDKSIDMILSDLPYGTTKCLWDSEIPLEQLWNQYKRILKNAGVVVLTASQPFTSTLVKSNLEWFKYEWIWEKNAGSNFATVRIKPMKEHESVLVFYKQQPTYKPIMQERAESSKKMIGKTMTYKTKPEAYGDWNFHKTITAELQELRFPRSIQKFNRERGLHPTQKPVALMEYLIKTYTNEGELVLDNCIGSGTTAVACIATNRRFIGIELNPEYIEIAERRLSEVQVKMNLA